MVKTAILAMRSARWRWQWSQRELLPGDEMSGMQDPDFQKLVKDIYEFQYVHCLLFPIYNCLLLGSRQLGQQMLISSGQRCR
jgi:hypothetical protein